MGRTRSRSAALVRAEHHAAPVKLTTAQKSVVAEAVRRGEDLREELEAKVTAYGRWLLSAVFADDAAAALDAKSQNPVWLEIVRRAGGPTLRVSRHLLYAAVAITARDRRITDQAWHGLDSNRKEMLLPIADDAGMREAAQHVAKFNLSEAETRHYVTALLAADGKQRQIRLTGAQLLSRVRALRQSIGTAAVLRRVDGLRQELEPADRDRIAGEVDKLRDALLEIGRTLRGRR